MLDGHRSEGQGFLLSVCVYGCAWFVGLPGRPIRFFLVFCLFLPHIDFDTSTAFLHLTFLLLDASPFDT